MPPPDRHQATQRQHILGYYEPGKSPIIVDSARFAGLLGESVLHHEHTHQALTLATSHGQFTVILEALRRYNEAANGRRDVTFNIEQQLNLLVDSAIVCHEGYATWHQVFYLATEYGLPKAVEAYEQLPKDYQNCYLHFDIIAYYFEQAGLKRCGWQSISTLIGAFAHAALATPIFEQFSAERPSYAELKQFLSEDRHNPDRRFGKIFVDLQDKGESLAKEVLTIFDDMVSFTGERDGSRWWSANPKFAPTIIGAVLRWTAVTAELPIDERLLRRDLQKHRDHVLNLYRIGIGLSQQPTGQSLPLSPVDAHSFEIDTADRSLPLLERPTVAAIGEEIETIVATNNDVGTYHRAGWILAFGRKWSSEIACVIIKREQHRFEMRGTHVFYIPNSSVADLISLYTSDAVLVLPSLCLTTAVSHELRSVLRRSGPIFVFVEKTSARNILKIATRLGAISQIEVITTTLKPVFLALTVTRKHDARYVVALVDPLAIPDIVATIRRRTHAPEPTTNTLASTAPELALAFWVCTHTTAADIPRAYP